jgi:hypothetical protein
MSYIFGALGRGKRVFFAHHADGDGMCSQAVFNRVTNTSGRQLLPKREFYPITYENNETAIAMINRAKPEMLVFSDYYPHPKEFEQIEELWNAERIIIFDKHPGREDISAIEKLVPNIDIAYINPSNFMAADPEKFGFKRGTPIGYFLAEVARKNLGVDCRFLESYALRSYGFIKEAECFEKTKSRKLNENKSLEEGKELGIGLMANFNKCSALNDAVILMSSHKVDNCTTIVEALSKTERYDSQELKPIKDYSSEHKLPSRNSDNCGHAAGIGGMFSAKHDTGKIALFPLKTGMFEQPKAAKGVLHERAKANGRDTSLIIMPVMADGKIKRYKISLMTDAEISPNEFLRKAYEKLPETIERNYGGHDRRAGGFACKKDDFPDVMVAVMNEYYALTGQNIKMERSWLMELYGENGNRNGSDLAKFM